MSSITKMEKLILANLSLKQLLSFEQKNSKHRKNFTELVHDVKAKDEIIGRQLQDLDRIYKSKLWKIYLLLKPIIDYFKKK